MTDCPPPQPQIGSRKVFLVSQLRNDFHHYYREMVRNLCAALVGIVCKLCVRDINH